MPDGPVGAGRRAPSAALRRSLWVRYQLPASHQAGKAVALTFDDGPDPRFTPPILAILARARAQATFFMVGSQAATHPDLVRRVARAGQAVGGHTWHHGRSDRLASAAVAAEVDCTDQLLANLAGHPVRLVRPPDGAYDASAVGLLAARGVALMLWTVDSRDWARPGVGQIQATVARELRPGAIILFHDGGGDRSQTVAALPGVLGCCTSAATGPLHFEQGVAEIPNLDWRLFGLWSDVAEQPVQAEVVGAFEGAGHQEGGAELGALQQRARDQGARGRTAERAVLAEAAAAVRSEGSTTPTTSAWRVGTSIWLSATRASSSVSALARLGAKAIAASSRLDGRWVRTIAASSPIRSARRTASWNESAYSSPMVNKTSPSSRGAAPKRRASQ